MLAGLCAEAMAAPMASETPTADTNSGTLDSIAADLDFSRVIIGASLFDDGYDTDPGDAPWESEIIAKALAGDTYLPSPQPPAAAVAVGGVVLLGIFKMLCRVRHSLRHILRRSRSTRGRRRKVRIDLRMMA